MTFDEANVWCMDHRVEVASTNGGKTLQLSAHGESVSDELADGSWYTWKATFIRLVERLRALLPPPTAGDEASNGGNGGSAKTVSSKIRRGLSAELATSA